MAEGAYSVAPLSPLRKVIAARMAEAGRTIPHFRLVADIEMDAILGWRQRANAAWPDGRISVNDCVIKACAAALMAHPDLNCQFVDGCVHRYHSADISVVVSVDGGLSTPIVRDADRKSIREIAEEVRLLMARAAAGQLKMSEIVGGSFSISNLGGYGVDQFDAIINAPQCAILAVGRAKPRMIAADHGQTRLATMMRATLSIDHRVLDGVAGAKFLATLREQLEHLRSFQEP